MKKPVGQKQIIREAVVESAGMEETKVLWCWNCERYVKAVKVPLGWDCPHCGAMIG